MLPTLESPELIFGICAPIGIDTAKVRTMVVSALAKYRYQAVEFKVTTLMKSIQVPDFELADKPVEDRYDTHIKYANRLCQLFGNASVLAMICCGAIRAHRRQSTGDARSYLSRTAYVFEQFKRQEEIGLLRQIYGRLFVLISVYSDVENRERFLIEKIADSHAVSRPKSQHQSNARALLDRDENEEGVQHGQGLRNTFPLADLFLNIDDQEAAEKALDRFLRAFFGAYTESPTPDEYGMYLAKSASFRSLDLSRQVGAAIVAGPGEIVTMGCNEVPKPNGGTYWAGDDPDDRDYHRGHDENDRIKRSLLADVVRRLCEAKLVTTERTIDELVEFVLEQAASRGSLVREAELMDLLEFGRIIHAEMAALCDAARLGKSVMGASLYCTTFPCHICAKHIVASGIKRVVFVEPYPKSYAQQLHYDSIVVRTGKLQGDKVQFEPFIGISPFRYRELFERGKRKDDYGKLLKWDERTAAPIVRYTVATYIENETAIMAIFRRKAEELIAQGLIQVAPVQQGWEHDMMQSAAGAAEPRAR